MKYHHSHLRSQGALCHGAGSVYFHFSLGVPVHGSSVRLGSPGCAGCVCFCRGGIRQKEVGKDGDGEIKIETDGVE